MLTKERLLAFRPRLKEIFVPELGESVFIRPITENERCKFLDLMERFSNAPPGERTRKAIHPLIQWALCNEDGTPFFATLEELAKYAEGLPGSIFVFLQNEISDHSAFTQKAREEIEKNSPVVPSEKSSSD